MYNYGDDAWSLPVNRGTAATNYNTEYLQLTQQGTDNAYKVATEDTFTKIYESNIDDLDGYPDLYAINKLKENDDYTLTTIYVWQGEEGDTVPDIESKDDMSKENGWTEYLYKKEQDYIFTKDESSTGTGSNGSTINYIHVDDYTVIVLDYDVVTVSFSTTADFFDYNITDGYLYTDETHSTTGRTTSNGDYPSSRKYVNTVGQGINTYSSNNGSSHYAFGNMNTGTGYQYQYLGSLAISSLNFINKYNGYQSSATGDIDESYVVGGFSGASFGLATDSSGAGISYNSALTMPTNDLFSESSSENNAKKYLGRSTVTFTQTGDTYTLKSVSGTADTTKADAENMTGTSISINNLDTFIHPTGYGKTSAYTIFTNSFWPLDSLRYNYMDPVFGAYTIDSTGSNVNVVYDEGSGGVGTSSEWHYYDGMPASDDGINHNSYFGMTFSIDFTLTDDYCGPLDYYFFGDDDMWVYLTKVDENGNATGTSELVLDIGGVHSSIGEHVNLWNHIQHTATTATTSGIAETASTDNTESQAGTYRLTFYYTERGASGSSCYMWFTLPSVSASTVENNAGSLRVEKNVEGIEDSEEEFTFTLSMVDGDGQAVSALDYSAAVYNADGTIAKRNERQSDGSVTNNIFDVSGKTFTLTDGQYLIIWNLPVGTVCEVTESDPDGTIQYKTSYTVTQTPDEIVGQEQSGTGRNVTDVGIEDGETAYVVFTNIVSNELPNAGSIGTRPFTIAGMLIIAIGGTGLVYMKKRKKGGAIH